MSFAHPIFTQAVTGGTRLASRAAQIIFREIGNSAVRQAADAVVGLVVETAEEAAQFSVEALQALSVEAAAALLGVHCPGVNEDRVVRNDAAVNRILNSVAEKDGGAIQLAEEFENRARAFQFGNDVAMAIAGISFPAGCALGILRSDNDLVASRKFPEGSGAPSRIRQCVRTSTDGQRVSREPHEWEYVRQRQWGDILAEARQWGNRVLQQNDEPDLEGLGDTALPPGLGIGDVREMLEEDSRSFATADYTFGNFVDGVNLRRGIEQLRRVNRSVTGERFTDLFRLLDVDRDSFVTQINNRFNWGLALRDIWRLGVEPGSGQQGTLEP